MSGNKTELPTKKRLKDAAKKGQIFKSRDLIVTLLLIVGILYLIYFFSVNELLAIIRDTVTSLSRERNISQFVVMLFLVFVKLILFLIALSILATVIPSLFQSGFIMATQALKLNFNAFNPVNGLKKIFSLRNVKDFVKANLYLATFCTALYISWHKNKHLLFAQLYITPHKIIPIWGQILQSLLFTIVMCIVLILILDTLAEYFLYIRDNKMDKQEVKREYKEQESSPEVKSRRRSLHQEILSDQDKMNVRESKVIIANPTHIAIGIFFEPEIFPAPVISLIEKNQRAVLTRKYAKEQGIPVVEDIPLARRLYKTHSKHSLVSLEELDTILRILVWLQEIENTQNHIN